MKAGERNERHTWETPEVQLKQVKEMRDTPERHLKYTRETFELTPGRHYSPFQGESKSPSFVSPLPSNKLVGFSF